MKIYDINGDGYSMRVVVKDGWGKITSDLRGDDPNEDTDFSEFDAVESLVLAHACAGIDVSSPAYVEGLNTTINAIIQ